MHAVPQTEFELKTLTGADFTTDRILGFFIDFANGL